MDNFHANAIKRLTPYPNKTFIRQFSVEAAKGFDDGSLDFVYIDGAHDFSNVVNDLAAWTPKVKKGGLICGHDYVMRGMGPTTFGKANKTFHVMQAIDAWTLAFLIDPYFLLGRKEPRQGEIRDKIRSWMWVNE
jgi:predicted O-methyltransferase YrrM